MVNLISLLLVLAFQGIQRRPDILVADFEGKDYGSWHTTGTAFGSAPAHGTLPEQMPVSGFLGKGLVNSFNGGDDAVGTLTSPPFRIQRKFVNFLIGGGKFAGKTCMNLIVDGEVIRTATGPNEQPGGSEALNWKFWDVSQLQGREAILQIVDDAKGGWGHISVDQIMESDSCKEMVKIERIMAVKHRYLNFPVKTGAPKIRVSYEVDGNWAREFTVELTKGKPDFYAFSDVSNYQGKSLKISATSFDRHLLDKVRASDEPPSNGPLYREKLRPQFHFSSRVGWLNDPNGLVYYHGEYHLFYQHNPYGWAWDNMHWGHAVSSDLMHWKELPIAIYPHQWDDWVFSGSATVDYNNTAGFGKDALVAAFTSTGRGECIAYSLDRGRTFQEFAGNPVVKHSGRDPKLVWYAPGNHWVMAVYNEFEGKQWIAIYSSRDLKDWKLESRIEGFYECPELFEIPIEGRPGETRWVIYAANGEYRLGSFDGKVFTPETEKIPLNWGNLFYASQTYNNLPDGRRVQMSWGRAETPSMPFNQCMLFPTQLKLALTEKGLKLLVEPIAEIARLQDTGHHWTGVEIGPDQPFQPIVKGEQFDLSIVVDPQASRHFGLKLFGQDLKIDLETSQLTFKENHAPIALVDGKIQLRVLIDRTTTEVYANHGRIYMPVGNFNLGAANLAVFAKDKPIRIQSFDIWSLRPAMNK